MIYFTFIPVLSFGLSVWPVLTVVPSSQIYYTLAAAASSTFMLLSEHFRFPAAGNIFFHIYISVVSPAVDFVPCYVICWGHISRLSFFKYKNGSVETALQLTILLCSLQIHGKIVFNTYVYTSILPANNYILIYSAICCSFMWNKSRLQS